MQSCAGVDKARNLHVEPFTLRNADPDWPDTQPFCRGPLSHRLGCVGDWIVGKETARQVGSDVTSRSSNADTACRCPEHAPSRLSAPPPKASGLFRHPGDAHDFAGDIHEESLSPSLTITLIGIGPDGLGIARRLVDAARSACRLQCLGECCSVVRNSRLTHHYLELWNSMALMRCIC